MKGPRAVILAVAMLAGCRSSQPATNPFLRTTVPPPGTGQGMMVMPGEAIPPVVTAPGVAATSPPAIAPALPVTPVPAQPAPLIGPPPPLGPQEKFQPPGGSYLYHQSSHDHRGAGGAGDDAQRALAAIERRDSAAEIRAGGRVRASPAAVQQASHLDNRFRVSTGGAPQKSSLEFSPPKSRGDPPEGLAMIAVGQTAPSSSVRIVGESSEAHAPRVSSSTGQEMIRMTAGASQQANASSSGNAGQPTASRIAIVAPVTVSRAANAAGPNRDAGAVKSEVSSGASPRYELEAIEPLSR
ncbi:MAG: hypothetical protein WD063_15415 [Pirellulales bacterium]